MTRQLIALLTACSVAALLLSGCVPTYNSDTSRFDPAWFGGVRSSRIEPNIYRINANGNAYSSSSDMADFAYLRAAQLALENGKPAFIMLETKDLSTAGRILYNPAQGSQQLRGGSTADGSIPTIGSTAPSGASYERLQSPKPGEGLIVALLTLDEVDALRARERANGAKKVTIYGSEVLYKTIASRVRGNPPSVEEIKRKNVSAVGSPTSVGPATLGSATITTNGNFVVTPLIIRAKGIHDDARYKLVRLQNGGASKADLALARQNEEMTLEILVNSVNL